MNKIKELYDLGTIVLGSRKSFLIWLKSPHILLLGGETPINLLDKEDGIDTLINALHQLQHGTF